MPNLKISPQSALLTAGQATTFVATNVEGQQVPVKWSLNPPLGSLTTVSVGTTAQAPAPVPSASYIAPPVVATTQAVALIASTDTESASATIALTPDLISIVPSSVALRANQAQQFIAMVASGSDEEDAITWILSPPAGKLDQTGLYVAPDDIQETATLSVIAAHKRLGKQAAATVTLASEPWRGLATDLLAAYLFLVFCVVFLIIGLWPIELPNSLNAKRSADQQVLQGDIPAPERATGSGSEGASQPNGAARAVPASPATSPSTDTKNPVVAAPQQTQGDKDAQKDLVDKKNEGATTADRVHTLIVQSVNRDIDLICLVLLAGALGSFVHTAQSFSAFAGNRTLKSSWVWWYSFSPFIGAGLALVVYSALRGGLLTVGATVSEVNPYGLVAGAAMAGMFSKAATTKLGDVFNTLFQSDKFKQNKDQLTPGSQTQSQVAKPGTDSSTGSPATAK